MYILLDGMPGTGKTAVAEQLVRMTGASYMKSVLSDTKFGNQLRQLRTSGLEKELELLILSDLAMDELRAQHILQNGSLIRDKAFCATLGHLSVHGFVNYTQGLPEILRQGYQQLQNFSCMPDVAVHLSLNEDKIRQHFEDKKDISEIDAFLLEHMELYRRQDEAVAKAMRATYGNRFQEIECFQGTIAWMAQAILDMIPERGGINEENQSPFD